MKPILALFLVLLPLASQAGSHCKRSEVIEKDQFVTIQTKDGKEITVSKCLASISSYLNTAMLLNQYREFPERNISIDITMNEFIHIYHFMDAVAYGEKSKIEEFVHSLLIWNSKWRRDAVSEMYLGTSSQIHKLVKKELSAQKRQTAVFSEIPMSDLIYFIQLSQILRINQLTTILGDVIGVKMFKYLDYGREDIAKALMLDKPSMVEAMDAVWNQILLQKERVRLETMSRIADRAYMRLL